MTRTPEPPLSTSCSNAGFYDRWTCPGCYDDLPNTGEGTFICERCGNTVECTLERQPICQSRIADIDEDDT